MVDDLRVHAGRERGPIRGDFVLYWMQGVAMRSSANFALNFAVEQANQLGLPVLVYQGLRQAYPWASDRLHTFILESAVDLYHGFTKRGIQYAFYLETPAPRPARSPLVDLARRAALVVTDFFPTFIQPRQLRALRAKVETPVVAIDSTTVVPLRYHTREYSTARAIRPVLHEALPHYLFPIENPAPRVRRQVEVPFDQLLGGETGRAHIARLVSGLDIDHSVTPAPTIRGGERAARDRLATFIRSALPIYSTQRSDPNVEATSRLSPYLHFGNLSIHEVLLTAQAAGPSAEFAKFLDEALVWRELAHNLCFMTTKHRTLAAVPAWARQELDDHGGDPRTAIYHQAELEHARTHDDLWNACQRSLVHEGELHNYLRMLWGKSVLLWTENANRALKILEHLNNKYALDGRDPNSYGGILWCFGRFDRPFYRRPILGTVRYMSTKAAAAKFDAAAVIKRAGSLG